MDVKTGGQMYNVNLELFGRDHKIIKALDNARSISIVKVPALIVGENGTGKKTLAKFIHQSSSRALGPIEFVNCSLEFGEVEKAILGFRDEDSNRFIKGALEKANGGTVVFSEIDMLTDELQRRLHVIFNELDDYDIDVRIICTTSKNLSKLVGSGRFYRGLYTQVAGSQINLVPLRERIFDLEYSIRYFLNKYGHGQIQLSEDAKDKLLKHYWANNLTEVDEVLRTSLIDLEGSTLELDHICIGEKKTINNTQETVNENINLMSLKDAERLLIQKALIHTSENRTQAAKILGVSIRTLRNKINEYRGHGNPYFVNLR